jgi:hypothetical protein
MSANDLWKRTAAISTCSAGKAAQAAQDSLARWSWHVALRQAAGTRPVHLAVSPVVAKAGLVHDELPPSERCPVCVGILSAIPRNPHRQGMRWLGASPLSSYQLIGESTQASSALRRRSLCCGSRLASANFCSARDRHSADINIGIPVSPSGRALALRPT